MPWLRIHKLQLAHKITTPKYIKDLIFSLVEARDEAPSFCWEEKCYYVVLSCFSYPYCFCCEMPGNFRASHMRFSMVGMVASKADKLTV